MKSITRGLLSFATAFLIVFSTFGNAFLVAEAIEPVAAVQNVEDNVLNTAGDVTDEAALFVAASPESGEVEQGTLVSLTCATEGAEIYYSTTGDNFTKYTEEIKVSENTVIKAFASLKDGEDAKDTFYEFSYTVKENPQTESKSEDEKKEETETKPVTEDAVSTEDATNVDVTDSADAPAEHSYAEGQKHEDIADGDSFVLVFEGNKVLTTNEVVDKKENKTLKSFELKADEDGHLYVEKDESNEGDIASIAVLTANKLESGFFTLVNSDNKYLTSGATGSALYFTESQEEYSTWEIVKTDAGAFRFKNEKARYGGTKEQWIEYYSSFTTYSYADKNAAKFDMAVYSFPEVRGEEPQPEPEPEIVVPTNNENKELKAGDSVVIYCSGNVLSATANKKKLDGVAATIEEDGNLTAPEGAVVLKVESVEGSGEFAFKDAATGAYLTSGATGSELKFAQELTDLGLWIPEAQENGFYLRNKAAFYKETTPQYMEFYSGFTTYSLKNGGDIYLVRFFNVKTEETEPEADVVKVDESTVLDVASWAGNANYEEAGLSDIIFGDYVSSNDLLDKSAEFSAFVNGSRVQGFLKSTSKTGTNYCMGATGVGFGDNDFLQLKFPFGGYGKGTISFRLKASKTGAGSYQLQYSTDGETFNSFTKGTYAYSYTKYEGGVQAGTEAGNGDITDGVANISTASYNSQFTSFTFEIPEEANDAEQLIIRLVPGKTSVKGEAVGKGGTIRIDSVYVKASPVVSSGRCAYVKAVPESGDVSLGTAITLSSATEGATISYSLDGINFQDYSEDNKPVLTELPALLRAVATKDGLKRSIETKYRYAQSQVETVVATPNGGSIRTTDRIKLQTKTEGATIYYAYVPYEEETSAPSDDTVAADATTDDAAATDDVVTEPANDYEWITYTEPFEAKELPCSIVVKAVKDGYLDSAVRTLKYTKKTSDRYNIYFGQVHSHTNFSDGAGDCEEAFRHASTEVANLDFLAVTDHSNSLDNQDVSDITKNVDTSADQEWTLGHTLAKKYSNENFTCLYGYEMTWSNGLGHMNTFCSPGFQSRTQKDYSTYATALQNYYAALNKVPDSISMFNHPGTTFGDFQDFAYYSEANDALINLIEVGNGEGAIGSSGYFPSYEYYTRALDKGWHIAPTNNQDNHKGLWGDANTARTVVLADANNEDSIYDAMRNRRIYATEDNNLNIYYTLNGYVMGSILEKDSVGSEVEIKVDLDDKSGEALGKVQVIVNGGIVAAQESVATGAKAVEFTVPSDYSYYYIKVVEADGDIAVTAPVWVGDVEACGLNGVSTTTTLPVQGESLDVNIEFYNNEKTELSIDEVTIELQDAENNVTKIATLTNEAKSNILVVESNGTAKMQFNYTYKSAGKVTYIVTAKGRLLGVDKVYVGKLTVDYASPEMVGDVIIDGTHYNDYVMGYYGGNMGNFITLCAEQKLRATVVKDKITAETLKNAKFLIISAPASKNGTSTTGDYVASTFEDEFVELVKDYVAGGGNVIICGIADYSNYKAAAEGNRILEAIGSTIRLNSDEIIDDTNNGGQAYRLYPTNYNADSYYLSGVKEGQKYSQYSGCSISIISEEGNEYVDAAEKLVTGFETTYSKDCKDETGANTNTTNDNLGKITFLAHQNTKAGGEIFVAGGVFVSDFEVKAEMDNNDSLPYINYNIAKNIIKRNKVVLKTSTIAEARKGNTGDVFAVEGYVTSGTDNEYNKFFDTIYIQDETAGIDIFPYAETGLKLGTKVRIEGFVSSYQGDKELKVLNAEILDEEPKIIEPTVVSTKDAMDYENNGGSLLKTSGVVTRVSIDKGTLAEFWIKDSTGVEAAIFIDGYIYSGTTGKNTLAETIKVGDTVSAVGVLYMHPEGESDVSVPVFRVRNCDEIVRIAAAAPKPEAAGAGSAVSDNTEPASGNGDANNTENSSENSDAGNTKSQNNVAATNSTVAKNNSNAGAATDNLPAVLGAFRDSSSKNSNSSKSQAATVVAKADNTQSETAVTESQTTETATETKDNQEAAVTESKEEASAETAQTVEEEKTKTDVTIEDAETPQATAYESESKKSSKTAVLVLIIAFGAIAAIIFGFMRFRNVEE